MTNYLVNRIDNLLGWVIPTGYENVLPSPLALTDRALISLLDMAQLAIWEKIQTFKETVTEDNAQYETGHYFTDRDLIPEGQVDVPKYVLVTLNLLEQMGLIVEVSQRNPLTNDLMPFFRLVEDRDDWKPMSQVDNEGEIQ